MTLTDAGSDEPSMSVSFMKH